MMATLFGICSESCNCSEETCSLKGAQFFQITQREETPCAETTTCSVCDVFSRHLRLCALMARAHSSKNSRMTQLLVSSTALHQIYTLAVPCQLSPAERVQRKAEVKDLLCKIFDCKRNRLQCMKHIGQLAQLLPKLLCVQLVTVHSATPWGFVHRLNNNLINTLSITLLFNILSFQLWRGKHKMFFTPGMNFLQ